MVTKPLLACSFLFRQVLVGPRGQAAPAGVRDYCRAQAAMTWMQVRLRFPMKCQLPKPLYDLTLIMFEGGGESTLKTELCLPTPPQPEGIPRSS